MQVTLNVEIFVILAIFKKFLNFLFCISAQSNLDGVSNLKNGHQLTFGVIECVSRIV